MSKGLTNKGNCTGVVNIPPHVKYAPCGGEYTQSDCVFISNGVFDGSMDLGANPSLSEVLVCLFKRIGIMQKKADEREKLIKELTDKIKKIEDEK